jgi:hypothetical protein
MANRIKESNITPGAVTSDKIAPGTVSASNISPGTISSDKIAPGTIANDRLANTGITINGTTIALGASGNIVAGTDWQSVVTADGSTATTASAGEGYFIDTTSNTHTINLPSSPTQGDEVTIVDYAGTFGTNKVTVGRNGSNIDGVAVDGTLATERLNVRFVYIDATQGWRAIFDDASESYGATYITATGGTVTESGDYKIHTFTGDGCFVVSSLGNPAGGGDNVSYMVVAGGASGGGGSGPGTPSGGGGGGGAGGFREGKCTSDPYSASPLNAPTGLTITATTYPVTIGGGGSHNGPQKGNPGSNSVFSTITSTGGGGGGIYRSAPNPTYNTGIAGGSGGGAGGGPFVGGTGNTPPVSPPQGQNGGYGDSKCGPAFAGAGGGGATAAGGNSTNPVGGPGGAGATTSISGSPTAYAGGGGGGAGNGTLQPGGTGGGGAGGHGSPGSAIPGTANTGGGGGGGKTSCFIGGAGGKGIVIIRYKFQ